MSLQEYLDHYIVWQDMLKFFGVAMGGAAACIALILIYTKVVCAFAGGNRKTAFTNHSLNAIQRFYSVIFSGASILSFLSIYYLLDRFLEIEPYREIWENHKDGLLLLLIVISIIFNNLLDRVLVPVRKVSRQERASVRVVGMLYVILIFVYIKYIYENNNYDGFIMYFLGLMIGRFVYFDASFREFFQTILDALKQIPIMLVGLAYTALMSYYGFSKGYLLKSNGVLVSVFIAHLFMIVAIFITHHSHIVLLFTKGSYKDK